MANRINHLKETLSLKISEINIVPVIPKDGLVGFVSFVINEQIYLGSIAIYTRISGGYRLLYPTKKSSNKNISIFYPINKSIGQHIENLVFTEIEKVMNLRNNGHLYTDD